MNRRQLFRVLPAVPVAAIAAMTGAPVQAEVITPDNQQSLMAEAFARTIELNTKTAEMHGYNRAQYELRNQKPLGYTLEVDPEIVKMMPDILMDNGTLRQYPLPRAGQMMAVPGRITPIYETMNAEVEILD